MKLTNTFVLTLGISLLSGCQRGSPTPSTTSAPLDQRTTSTTAAVTQPSTTANTINKYRPRIDACSLLTSSEIAAVQNESVKATKLSGAVDGGFDVSQCFFTLPTFANSVSLKVTQQREAKRAQDPREFWRVTFHEDERRKDDERDRERGRKEARERLDRGEEESKPPLRITGIGDEAYWIGDQVGGALYVLKGSNYLRISVGGAGDRTAKIKKSTALAQKALERLTS